MEGAWRAPHLTCAGLVLGTRAGIVTFTPVVKVGDDEVGGSAAFFLDPVAPNS